MSSDVYFEYRAPYLVWYDWTPKKRRFSLNTRKDSEDQTSKLSEDKVMFVKNVKLVEKAGTEWMMVEGKVPDNFKYQSKYLKFYVKGHNQNVTSRWFEVISRWYLASRHSIHAIPLRAS